jgi:alkylation response protein AidB-like acyl-CoA dehydrogenase
MAALARIPNSVRVLPAVVRCVSYKAPQRDIEFVLHEVLNVSEHYKKINFPDCSTEIIQNVISETAKFSEEQLSPLDHVGDAQGCTLKDGKVTTPKGFKEAYAHYIAGGWQGLTVPEQYGGQGLQAQYSFCQIVCSFSGLPLSLGLIKSEIIGTANWSWGMYPGLSIGAINTLLLHGSEEQKKSIKFIRLLMNRVCFEAR